MAKKHTSKKSATNQDMANAAVTDERPTESAKEKLSEKRESSTADTISLKDAAPTHEQSNPVTPTAQQPDGDKTAVESAERQQNVLAVANNAIAGANPAPISLVDNSAATVKFMGMDIDVHSPFSNISTDPVVRTCVFSTDYAAFDRIAGNPSTSKSIQVAERATKRTDDIVKSYTLDASLKYSDLGMARQLSPDETVMVNSALRNLQANQGADLSANFLYRLWSIPIANHGANPVDLYNTSTHAWNSPFSRTLIDDFITDMEPTADETCDTIQLLALLKTLSITSQIVLTDAQADPAQGQIGVGPNQLIFDVTQLPFGFTNAGFVDQTHWNQIVDDGIRRIDLLQQQQLPYAIDRNWNSPWLFQHSSPNGNLARVDPQTIDDLNAWSHQAAYAFGFTGGQIQVNHNPNQQHQSAGAVARQSADMYAQRLLRMLFAIGHLDDGTIVYVLNRPMLYIMGAVLSYVIENGPQTYLPRLRTLLNVAHLSASGHQIYGGLIYYLTSLWNRYLRESLHADENTGVWTVQPTPIGARNYVRSGAHGGDELFMPTYITTGTQNAVDTFISGAEFIDREGECYRTLSYLACDAALLSERVAYYYHRGEATRAIDLISRSTIAALVDGVPPADADIVNQIATIDAIYVSLSMFFKATKDANLPDLTSYERDIINNLNTNNPILRSFPNSDSLTSLSAKGFMLSSAKRVNTQLDFIELHNQNAHLLRARELEPVTTQMLFPFVDPVIAGMNDISKGITLRYHNPGSIFDAAYVHNVFGVIQNIVDFIDNNQMQPLFVALNGVVHSNLEDQFVGLFKMCVLDAKLSEAIALGSYEGLLRVDSRAGDVKVQRVLRPIASQGNVLIDIKLYLMFNALTEVRNILYYVLAQYVHHVMLSQGTDSRATIGNIPASLQLVNALRVNYGFHLNLAMACRVIIDLFSALKVDAKNTTGDFSDSAQKIEKLLTAFANDPDELIDISEFDCLTKIPEDLIDVSAVDAFDYRRARVDFEALYNALLNPAVLAAVNTIQWQARKTTVEAALRRNATSVVMTSVTPAATQLQARAATFENWLIATVGLQSYLEDGAENASSDSVARLMSTIPGVSSGSGSNKKRVGVNGVPSLADARVQTTNKVQLSDLAFILGRPSQFIASNARSKVEDDTSLLSLYGALYTQTLQGMRAWLLTNAVRYAPMSNLIYREVDVADPTAVTLQQNDALITRAFKLRVLKSCGLLASRRALELPMVTTETYDNIAFDLLLRSITSTQLAFAFSRYTPAVNVERVYTPLAAVQPTVQSILQAINIAPDTQLTVEQANVLVDRIAIVDQLIDQLAALRNTANGGAHLFGTLAGAIPTNVNSMTQLVGISLVDVLYLRLHNAGGTVGQTQTGGATVIDYVDVPLDGMDVISRNVRILKKNKDMYTVTSQNAMATGRGYAPMRATLGLQVTYDRLPNGQLPYGVAEKVLDSMLVL